MRCTSPPVDVLAVDVRSDRGACRAGHPGVCAGAADDQRVIGDGWIVGHICPCRNVTVYPLPPNLRDRFRRPPPQEGTVCRGSGRPSTGWPEGQSAPVAANERDSRKKLGTLSTSVSAVTCTPVGANVLEKKDCRDRPSVSRRPALAALERLGRGRGR